MIKCPNCGSTAQLKVIDMGIVEDPLRSNSIQNL